MGRGGAVEVGVVALSGPPGFQRASHRDRKKQWAKERHRALAATAEALATGGGAQQAAGGAGKGKQQKQQQQEQVQQQAHAQAPQSVHAHRGALVGGIRRRVHAPPRAHQQPHGPHGPHTHAHAPPSERTGGDARNKPVPPRATRPAGHKSRAGNPYRTAAAQAAAAARGLAAKGRAAAAAGSSAAGNGAQRPSSAPCGLGAARQAARPAGNNLQQQKRTSERALPQAPAPPPGLSRPRRRQSGTLAQAKRVEQVEQSEGAEGADAQPEAPSQGKQTDSLGGGGGSSSRGASPTYAGTAARTLRDKVSVLQRENAKKDEAIQLLLSQCAQKDNAVRLLQQRVALLQEEVQLLTDAEADADERARDAMRELALLANLHGMEPGPSTSEVHEGGAEGGGMDGGESVATAEPATQQQQQQQRVVGGAPLAEAPADASAAADSQAPPPEAAEMCEVDALVEEIRTEVEREAMESDEQDAHPSPSGGGSSDGGDGGFGAVVMAPNGLVHPSDEWLESEHADAFLAMAARREAALQQELIREREGRAGVQRDFELLEGALSECDSQKRAYAARYHFMLLDEERTGTIGREELLRYETFAGLSDWVLERVLQSWNYQSGAYGRVCIDDFLGLVRHAEYKGTSEAEAFWFRVADVDCDGVLGRCDLRQFYDAVDITDAPSGTLMPFEDVMCMMSDMVKARRPERGISLKDIRQSKLGSTFFSMLLNCNGAMLSGQSAS